ncbi:MAG TPA: D-aminoacyl-tRNA deacylase [Casimicrobiaceae bacterium]|nr:D-aminoacyl-tRNA deacylase [Casimicrobiaceae bacterium]
MRAVVQRVREASVSVAGATVGAIGPGLLVLCGITATDGESDRDWLARKIVSLRIFNDDAGVMNRSLVEVGGALLAVSQFTLFASTRKGARPSYSAAAPPETAAPAFASFVQALERESDRPVATGQFGADMTVSLVNDGPVTIWLDSAHRE